MLEKNFWTAPIHRRMRRHHKNHDNNNDAANSTEVLTLKANVPRDSTVDLLVLSSPPRFIPQFQPFITPSVDSETLMHYDSRRGTVTFEYKQTIRSLTLDQYSWVMRELHHEERLPSFSFADPSKVVAIMNNRISLQSRRRHSMKKMSSRPNMLLLLLIPKTLFLHAATHIPMSKPLPPPVHCLVPPSFDSVPDDLYDRLCRYMHIATPYGHDVHRHHQHHHSTLLHVDIMCCCQCLDNGLKTTSALELVLSSSSTCSDDDDGDDRRHRRRQQQEQRKRRTSAFATTEYPHVLPSKQRPLSVSPVAPVAPSPPQQQQQQQQQHQCEYTLCIDRDKEEIIVAFGFNSPSESLLLPRLHDGVSVVPWPEGGWVLEWAAAQWRQVEMSLATALMRLCRATPAHYRVVLAGFQWGGALAALCASSLVITGLLTRHVTLCVMDAPRTGSVEFIERLQKYKVETIRVLRLNDPYSLWPPRTSGLCHLGETTIIWINKDCGPKMLKSKRCWDEVEDELAKLYRVVKVDFVVDQDAESKSVRSNTIVNTSTTISNTSHSSNSNRSTSTHAGTSVGSHCPQHQQQQREFLPGLPLCYRTRKPQ